MSRFTSKFLRVQRLAGIFVGLLLIVSGSLYFFGVSAQTEVAEKPSEQNLTLGKLAILRIRAGFGEYQRQIFLSDSTGSEQTFLPALGQFPNTPAWSPDGTKIVFVGLDPASPTQQDIFSMPIDGSSQFTNLTNTNSVQEQNPSWSITGKIAYERNSQIWTINADGSGQAQFTAITQPTPILPVWSPDGTKLAFTSDGDVWLINADGTNQHRLTTTSTNDVGSSWSPDGSKIVFVKDSNGIAVINVDGSNETYLTNTSDIQPSWSPDGTRIAFRRNSGTRGIYVMDADGGNQTRIYTDVYVIPTPCCDTTYYYPVWQPVAQTPNTYTISGRVAHSNLPVRGVTVNLSGATQASVVTDATGNYQFSGLPAGGNYVVSPSFPKHYFTPPNRSYNNLSSTQIANFEVLGVCQAGRCTKNGKITYAYNGEIYTINADGTGETNITNNPAGDGEPAYSPNGANIIFTTSRDGNSEIYKMNADGSNQVRLTNDPSTDYSSSYSYDGKSIVFASNRDGNHEIYKMNADGSNLARLTNDPGYDSLPAFSPDGQTIIFVSTRLGNTKMFRMNADGSNQQLLSDAGGFSTNYDRPTYSPDGSKIIFSYTADNVTQYKSIWTMNQDGTNRVQIGNGRYGNYSPDGMKISLVCCYIEPNRVQTLIYLANADGNGVQPLPTLTSSSNFPDAPDWQPLPAPRPASFDFDGDSRSDFSVFRPSNSAWYLLRSTAGMWVPVWGTSTDVLTPADYDGDLKTDVAVWRPSDGKYYILNSFDATVRIESFGLAGDVPTGGDWDGDGKADVAVFRSGAQGVFYYRGSMGNPNGNITFIPWGTSGDKPVASDYDGDGKTDAAVYRGGEWYVRKSSDGQFLGVAFGLGSDKTVPADYDGDGKADIAVYRDGIWYILRSAQGFAAFQFGIANDVPAPGDYDGDGKSDAAIYRDGVWWILNSQSSTAQAVALGTTGDKPLPSAYVR